MLFLVISIFGKIIRHDRPDQQVCISLVKSLSAILCHHVVFTRVHCDHIRVAVFLLV